MVWDILYNEKATKSVQANQQTSKNGNKKRKTKTEPYGLIMNLRWQNQHSRLGSSFLLSNSALLVTSIWLVATLCCQFLKLKKEGRHFGSSHLPHVVPKPCWFCFLKICFKAHSLLYILYSRATVQACIICWLNHCQLPTNVSLFLQYWPLKSVLHTLARVISIIHKSDSVI